MFLLCDRFDVVFFFWVKDVFYKVVNVKFFGWFGYFYNIWKLWSFWLVVFYYESVFGNIY